MIADNKEILERYELLVEENEELILKNKVLNEKIKAYEKEIAELKEGQMNNVDQALKVWLPKQKKKLNHSLEYLNIMAKKIEIEGIDSVECRRTNKINKIDYRFKLIKFYEDGIYQSEDFMVYHAQLLGGGQDLEQLKGFLSKMNRLKGKAAAIGAYELAEQAQMIISKSEEEDHLAACKLLGGFIREYKKLIANISEALELAGPEELLEEASKEKMSVTITDHEHCEGPRYISLSEEASKAVNDMEMQKSERQEVKEEENNAEEVLEERAEQEDIHQILEQLQALQTAVAELKKS